LNPVATLVAVRVSLPATSSAVSVYVARQVLESPASRSIITLSVKKGGHSVTSVTTVEGSADDMMDVVTVMFTIG